MPPPEGNILPPCFPGREPRRPRVRALFIEGEEPLRVEVSHGILSRGGRPGRVERVRDVGRRHNDVAGFQHVAVNLDV